MIVGVDHATRRMAFVAPETGWSARLVLSPRAADPLLVMREWADEILPADAVLVVEAALSVHGDTQTAIKMAYMAGTMASLRRGSTFINPGTWKMVALGKGHGTASKEEVAEWVRTENPSAHAMFAGDQDLCDAYAIGVAGQMIAEDPDVGRSEADRRRARVREQARQARRGAKRGRVSS